MNSVQDAERTWMSIDEQKKKDENVGLPNESVPQQRRISISEVANLLGRSRCQFWSILKNPNMRRIVT